MPEIKLTLQIYEVEQVFSKREKHQAQTNHNELRFNPECEETPQGVTKLENKETKTS